MASPISEPMTLQHFILREVHRDNWSDILEESSDFFLKMLYDVVCRMYISITSFPSKVFGDQNGDPSRGFEGEGGRQCPSPRDAETQPKAASLA